MKIVLALIAAVVVFAAVSVASERRKLRQITDALLSEQRFFKDIVSVDGN